MGECKLCGKIFEYNDDVGYAVDICGPFCDGVLSQQPEIERLKARVVQLEGHLDWLGWSSDGIQRARNTMDRICDLNKRALAIITDAIMHGMPITEEVAAVRNEIVGAGSDKGSE